ncbi:DUF262 domain-containing protein [Yinghuangia aomiensis]
MVTLDNRKLGDILAEVGSGTIQLPDFQREWKWDDERIRALIATVTLNYPLGVIMTLETGGTSPFRARPLTGVAPTGNRVPAQLLLDGQQRLTSLFQALFVDKPVETKDLRGKTLNQWYYIDIRKAVGPPADRDEAIVSVPSDKRLKADFARKVTLDLSTRDAEIAAAHFPCTSCSTGKPSASGGGTSKTREPRAAVCGRSSTRSWTTSRASRCP